MRMKAIEAVEPGGDTNHWAAGGTAAACLGVVVQGIKTEANKGIARWRHRCSVPGFETFAWRGVDWLTGAAKV